MTFFYDLNKRMAELSQKQTLAEHSVPAVQPTKKSPMTQALNERDMGKHNNKTTGFKALAAKTNDKIAGAQLAKMRDKGQVEEMFANNDDERRDAINAANPPKTPSPVSSREPGRIGGPAIPVKHHTYDRKSVASNISGKDSAAYDYREQAEEGRVDDVSKSVKSIYYPDKARSPVQKFDKSTGRFDKYMGKNSPLDDKEYAPDQTSRPAGMNPDPASRYKIGEEGGIPMTAKQKSFAALAPPRDKITFADKIAGAKQEVEEMLGDVAAEAMRSALGGKKQMADEGFDDMERDVKRRLSTPKVGDVKRGARHDIETTATGIRATRRHDDETDEQPTGEKRRAGRPKGADKGPERVTGKAYKHKGGRVKEDGMEDMIEPHDSGEYDREGEMAKDSIKTVVRHAQALEKILGDNDNLPEWVQSKLAKIESMMTAVDDYMQNQEGDDEMAMDEEKTSTRDSRAERAGRKVAKDIEYDEKKKDGIHGKRRGSEDDKAEKAGKKVTKDIEYDEKKKEKKVDETTTSGSVATGGDAPKASKGGMQVGKGIYDSMNREVENMIAESMSINVSMSTDDNGSHKNITVTAADEDAEMLAQLLRSAGIVSGGMSPDHGMAEAYGDVTATENKPDYPTDTEYTSMKQSTDPVSNDLNRNKTDVAGDGQTTIPVTAVHTQDEDALRRMMEMAGIKQQELKPWERTMKEDTIEEDELDEGWKEKMAAAALAGSMALGAGGAHAGTSGNQDAGSNTPQQAAGQTVGSMAQAQRINYQLRSMINTVKDLKQQNRLDPGFEKDYNQMKMVSNTGSPDSKVAGDFANAKMLKQLFQKYNMTLPYVQEDVAEGVVDTVKGVVKKGLEKLGHGSDEDMRKDLQKKMGVPPTGEKPADKKMEESLMKEFANFKI